VGTLGIGSYPIFNSDGANSGAGLILSSNVLFGTAGSGGVSGKGTVFAVNTDGTGFRTLHSFTAPDSNNGGTNSDGAQPGASLILSGNSLYGTASYGGSSGKGVVFSLKTDGTGFTVLYNFSGSDGANPSGPLIVSSNILYGTTGSGGSSTFGTVFKIKADGTGFNSLYSFTGGDDGAFPRGLLLAGNTLYGAALNGGSSDKGTLFAMNSDGTGFTALYSFSGSDGAFPKPSLILLANTLYGSGSGGLNNRGTVFAINTDGTGFTNLYSFTGGNDGQGANDLIVSNNILYGTTQHGGTSGSGTVFSLALGPASPPQLTITPIATNVILSWPTTGFALQSTTNLSSPVWTTNLLAPVVVNGQNVVTNPISGARQFFRLSQ
jgi:uncharacterized repeat protein (TIGR03803 family)